MYCRNCGVELPDWATFCDRCGTRVELDEPPAGPVGAHADPIEQVVSESAPVEPLWSDSEEPLAEVEEAEAGEAADETQFMLPVETQETQLLSVIEQLAAYTPDDEVPHHAIPEDAPQETSSEKTQFIPVDEVQAAEPEPREDEPVDTDDASGVSASEEEAETGDGDGDAPADEHDSAAEHEDTVEEAEEDEPAQADETPAGQSPSRRTSSPMPEPLQTLQVIDVGMDDGWPDGRGGYGQDAWDNHLRPSERRRREAQQRERERRGPNISLIAGLAAIGVFFALVLGFMALGNRDDAANAPEEEPIATSKPVAKNTATEIITSLDGWWKTGRTFDGRFWYLQNGLMETYAADGKLASETLLDPASVERMEAGPGGIEGAGYYLRDVGYYLRDDDQDTLHALAQDGTADVDANLLRTDPPAFVSEGSGEDTSQEPVTGEADDPSEYLLPESATRVYDASELESMSDHDLFVARNEIYARHGYVFETGELSTYFSSKSWYHPSDVFNEGEISEIERQNISTILSIEQARGSQYV